MRALLLAGLLLALALAGCSAAPPPTVSERALEWPPMAVRVSAPGPGEADGTMHVAWRDGRFGATTSGEGGLPAHAIVDGDELDTSATGAAWTRWDLAQYQATHPAALRLTWWNLVQQVNVAKATLPNAGDARIDLDLDPLAEGAESHLLLTIAGSHVAAARLEVPLDPGSPFLFEQEPGRPLPMTAEPALDPAAVLQGDAHALRGQQTILAWVRQHREQLGSYPDTLTPETLAVQALMQPWPTSPYDGQAMRDGGPMGHFDWKKCGADAAEFTGRGWDGALVRQSLGSGCP